MTAQTSDRPAGIASIGLHVPPLALPVEELAKLRGQDPKKYTLGLGCREMALCPEGFGAVELATEAARRALKRWHGDPERIGLIATGTESAVDMSRPLSAWVAEELGIRGPVRSYEVKHACYGGTLALRQALEWQLSGAAAGKAALVIATDVALYALGDPGEPTQGAGAVAMIVDEPRLAALDEVSHPWSEPAFDFWRPVGESFPRVDGKFSLDCYKCAAEHRFGALVDGGDAEEILSELTALCFHVPFLRMVKKAFFHVAESLRLSPERAEELFERKIDRFLGRNRMTRQRLHRQPVDVGGRGAGRPRPGRAPGGVLLRLGLRRRAPDPHRRPRCRGRRMGQGRRARHRCAPAPRCHGLRAAARRATGRVGIAPQETQPRRVEFLGPEPFALRANTSWAKSSCCIRAMVRLAQPIQARRR